MRIDHVQQVEIIDQRDREHHNHETHHRHNMRAYKATGDDMTVVIAETDDCKTIKIYLSDTKES